MRAAAQMDRPSPVSPLNPLLRGKGLMTAKFFSLVKKLGKGFHQ